MKIPQEKIQKLAEYTYVMHRKANDYTPYADLSKADKQSYLNEAKEQIEYINDNLEIIGVSPEEVDKLVHSLASTMEHSVMLMGENASLKQTIALHEASLHDMRGKMRKMQEKLDSVVVQSEVSTDMIESAVVNHYNHVEQTPTAELTSQQKNDYAYSCITSGGRNVKDGKALLCEMMGIPLTNKRAETRLWIQHRISLNGWDAVELACQMMVVSEVCNGAV